MYETERFFNRCFFTKGYMTTKAGTGRLHGKSCAQLFNKEKVYRELNNNLSSYV